MHLSADLIVSAVVGDGSFFGRHAPQAMAMANLFTNALILCGVIFVFVLGLIGFCIWRFRARDNRDPVQVTGNRPLEIGWTLLPIIVLTGLLVLTSRAMTIVDPPVDRASDLTIVAHQWWWEVRYPSGAITANEIHLPVGKPLVVRIESQDVVHDFWVASLGRKVDAIPGRPVNIWLQADRPGVYVGTCAEFCGAQHAWMRIRVVAQPPNEFLAWERHEASQAVLATAATAGRGLEIFRVKTCVSCHAIRGVNDAGIGPDLTHLAERSTLGAGVIANTSLDLTRWLADPQQIKPGCHMPNAQLSAREVADLVSYFETLR